MTLFAIWWERRVVARMQQRIGPNRVGPFGLLQSLADGLQLAFKEDSMPVMADTRYILAAIVVPQGQALYHWQEIGVDADAKMAAPSK